MDILAKVRHGNTKCETVAIQFNKQECAAVNQTAPDFVGCSPAGLSSALASMSLTPVPTASSSSASSSIATSSSVNPGLSTITGDVVTQTFPLSTGKPITATFGGRPLLTGSCAVPFFAMATGFDDSVTEFPEIGCSGRRPECCPFDQGTNAVVTKCPQDYFTTANACCPLCVSESPAMSDLTNRIRGYQVYYTAIGGQTPCYSIPSATLVPVSTPTVSDLTIITDHVFSNMYHLVAAAPEKHKLPTGAIIGISVNACLFVLCLCGIWFCIRRVRRNRALKAAAAGTTTYPPEEPALQMSRAPTTHELDSPEAQPGASDALSRWGSVPASSPPAYDQEKSKLKPRPLIPQELPGSMWMNEHHPAFSGEGEHTPIETTPSSPPTTPCHKATPEGSRSPVLSSVTSRSGNDSPAFVSPLGSPKPPKASP
ncbi:hypothetical protein PV08_06944 [Exophiala spinifera]|uniref:Uncharacterized protein n=1 Tax=Exophiala spinifera TaxID=91928 RepID=A0A0D2B5H2_9EURO|nr:uncharacterized protein PV08_06944 [Exophiala spinifera]KIW14163.1 hypothetical protein PV08_06944 [Exophiala spinifera]